MGSAGSPAQQGLTAAGRFAALQVADLEAVVTVERRSFANPWSVEELGWAVQEKSGLCMGLWVEEELIGYGIGQTEEGLFHLASLAIAPAWCQQGWGGRLLQELLSQARRRGCKGCRLEVRMGNRAALSLYRYWAFREEGRLAKFYTRPVEDGLVMYREL
ncbi:MAG: ribosomal-protein-alanine N-acetyltransferase [Candidatus Latescibacteria bacterium]|nr:ribosomal-protein-alanine N-acetyltransferase [Candidatus Latescibacterota bacterium]